MRKVEVGRKQKVVDDDGWRRNEGWRRDEEGRMKGGRGWLEVQQVWRLLEVGNAVEVGCQNCQRVTGVDEAILPQHHVPVLWCGCCLCGGVIWLLVVKVVVWCGVMV